MHLPCTSITRFIYSQISLVQRSWVAGWSVLLSLLHYNIFTGNEVSRPDHLIMSSSHYCYLEDVQEIYCIQSTINYKYLYCNNDIPFCHLQYKHSEYCFKKRSLHIAHCDISVFLLSANTQNGNLMKTIQRRCFILLGQLVKLVYLSLSVAKHYKVSVKSFHFHFQLINDVLRVLVSTRRRTCPSLRLPNLHHHLINLQSQQRDEEQLDAGERKGKCCP